MASILSLDVGARRIGLAVGDDESGLIATRPTLAGRSAEQAIDSLGTIVQSEGISRVIVGLPLTLAGSDSEQTRQVRAFARRLASRLTVPVELVDERLTTKLAQRLKRRSADDAAAAALILQSYLDRQRNRL